MTDPLPDDYDLGPNSEPTRRGLLAWLVGALAALPFVGGLVVAMRTGLSPIPAEGPARVPLCKKGDLPATGLIQRTVSFEVLRGPRVENVTEVVFLTRSGGEVLAMSGRCTHQGCPVSLDRELLESPEKNGPPLVCPCHDGAFTATGEPAGGPPTEPLPRLPIEVPDSDDMTIDWVRNNG